MKTKLLFLGLLITIQSFSQIVTIPDANFKAYLLGNTSINTNGNTEIEYSEASSFTGTINCSNRSISDLTGIETFIKLTILDCNDNQLTTLNTTNNPDLFLIKCDRNLLTSLDFTNNPRLSGLNCNSNQITSLNVSNNIQLSALNCYGNQISNIDVTNNIHLTHLNLNSNQLTSLDVSNNLSLSSLICNYNQLTAIDVSNNTMLKGFNCGNNQLSILDVSNNSLLETVFCSFNQIIDLDFSTNSALTKLRCNGNQLTSLNVKNGNNLNVDNGFFRIDDNPNLICVEVDIENYSTTNWVVKDAQTSYSVSCNTCIVNIPDVNFKNAVLNHTPIIDTNNDGEIQCSEAIAVTGVLNVAGKNIVDTTGLESFKNITKLYCSTNQISTLNVSQNTQLEELNCNSNLLNSIDVSQNINLNWLSCNSNSLTSIDVSLNTELKVLSLSNNQLTSLDVTLNSKLEDLSCVNNQLTSLDVTLNSKLKSLWCQLNQLTTLDVSQNVDLEVFYFRANLLTSIDLSQNSKLIRFGCRDNLLTTIDLSQNLDVEEIDLSFNQFTNIDLSLNTKLTQVLVNNNDLGSLNVANGNNQNINYIYMSFNPNLTCIQIDAGFIVTGSWVKDTTANYSINCNSCIVSIPDVNFKSAVLNHTPIIDSNNDGEIQCSEALAVTGMLNVANKGIVDTTGLEAFENITRLAMFSNSITSIDLSLNTLLTQLLLESNQLTTIDISMLSLLTDFKAHSNLFTSANVANGNNSNMWRMQLQGNSSLTCIQIDQGFTPPTNNSWLKDATANYSFNCGPCIVNIPDVNFKNAVLNHTPIIDTNNDGEIQCSEALAVTGVLNVANKGIVDTTGLEAFVNITRLAMFNNAITSIDLSSNVLLTQLLLESNQLTTIDISMLSLLTDFKAHSNSLTSVNIANGNNSNMWRMQLQGNPSLTCIKIDQGFTPPTNNSWIIDTTANYSTSCPQYPVANPNANISLNRLQRNNSNLVVYPNPTSNTISVKGIDSIEKLSLFTVGGDKLISRDKTNEMNISKLGKGIYWLIIETKEEVIKKKIIKK